MPKEKGELAIGGNRVSKKMAKEVNEDKQGIEAKIQAALRSRIQHFKENAEYAPPDFFCFFSSLMCDTTLVFFFYSPFD